VTPAQQAHYDLCIAQGTSPALAEMFALALPPAANSDREFLEGRGGCYDQFKGQSHIGDHHARVARQHGVDITGKVYMGGLARFPGDPEAWVSGRGDVRRICEQRGWGCEGAVSLPVTNVAEPERSFHVAPDLVEDRMAAVLEQMPPEEAACVDTQDLRAQAEESLKPVWAKGPTPKEE
jgi:hypothetical protein